MNESAPDGQELHVVIDSQAAARADRRDARLAGVFSAATILPYLFLWPAHRGWAVAAYLVALISGALVSRTVRRGDPVRRCLLAEHGLSLSTGNARIAYDIPWSRIQSVEEAPDKVVVHLVDGEIELDTGNPDVFQIARTVAQAIGQAPSASEPRGSLDEAEVERLIAVGGRKTVEAPLPGAISSGVRWFGAVGPAFAAALAFGCGEPDIGAVSLAIGVVASLGLWWLSERTTGHPFAIRVEAAGVVLQRRRAPAVHYPWHEIRSLERDGSNWRLQTYLGDLTFAVERTGEVAAVIRRVLDIQRAGHVLPRLGFVGDAAISPVREGEERAERGISRSEGET